MKPSNFKTQFQTTICLIFVVKTPTGFDIKYSASVCPEGPTYTTGVIAAM